ncbi:hypothetical protein NIES4071_21540 [Calothrix sp. NIES-4071]|nr:hypothetical protein NIES4071_21540 [Calothrix sp. NIES-4071]BAZ56486.1 hypothetical protein NIES4105_21490 [Calothrix sp. NIES-4105]
MLVPLTREKFEQLIPLIGTGPQYKYYWGNFSKLLQRLLISVVAAAVVLLLRFVLGLNFGPIVFVLGLISAFYWLWSPVFQASLRNGKCRRYKYCGFFRGRILDLWITEELIGKQETVNNKGELVIVENREKRINLEVGDETGFTAEYQAPLQVAYKAVTRGQIAEMLVFSNRADLSRIEEITDIYVPNRNIWISDYPYLRRDFFTEVGNRLRDDDDDYDRPRRRRRPQEDTRRRRNDDWSTEEDY